MSDKKSCHVCGTDLEFATDTYCGGTCADIAEMRTHDDQRIAELERENKVLSGRLERELDRAIPILEERNAALARAERAESVIMMAGNWPQTLSALESALSTFPAGRAFLSRWTADEKRASEAFGRAHNAEVENEKLRSLLKDGFAYVRDANRLMAADGDLDEEDEDGANEWLEKAAAALVER